MIPQLSIIIPCYKTQLTLAETLESVLQQDFKNWEAIIVNDGSPDNLEQIALEYVQKDSRFRYYKKTNGGLGSARNFGIKKSKGEIILPLDSDNKIISTFAKKMFKIFEKDPKIDIIYGDALYFGEKSGIWKVGEFNEYKLLERNYIDACAAIRKSVFDDIGLYDNELPFQGHEDWEFWLRSLKAEKGFYYLDELTFEYRVESNSMIRSFDKEMMFANCDYIISKHYMLYYANIKKLINENRYLRKVYNESIITKIKRKFKL